MDQGEQILLGIIQLDLNTRAAGLPLTIIRAPGIEFIELTSGRANKGSLMAFFLLIANVVSRWNPSFS